MAKRAKRVTIDKFAAEIRKTLQEYGDYIDQTVVTEAVHSTAQETADIIAKAAPKRDGKYAESISAGFPNRKGHKYTETVYSDSPFYRLPHLLERPHATRNGGRTRAFPHWETGENGVLERLITHIKEGLK